MFDDGYFGVGILEVLGRLVLWKGVCIMGEPCRCWMWVLFRGLSLGFWG